MSDEKQDEKQRATFYLPEGLIDRARNAAYWTPGMTLGAIAERGIAAEIDRLERWRGESFPPRDAELRGGRPIQS